MDDARFPLGQVPGLDDTKSTSAPDVAGTDAIIPSGQEGFGITPAMRQRLDERVAAAGGDVDTVYREIATQLAELESKPMPEVESADHIQYQADHALLVAELGYLEKVADANERK